MKAKWIFSLWVRDIRFWILLFFLVRLTGITNPPLEISHNWRQSSVNMIARNFYEADKNILYPRLDNAGDKSGITGTEFPLFNYLIYLCFSVFGFAHWYGRLINLVISSLGIYFFFRIIKTYFSPKTAFLSTIILLASLWFSFSRKIMPDTFSVSLSVMGLFFGLEYLLSGRLTKLLLFFILATSGVLSKLPAVVVLSPLILFLFDTGTKNPRKVILAVTVFFSLLLAFAWYFIWFPDLVSTYGFQFYYMGPTFPAGLRELFADPIRTLDNFYFDSLKYSGFAVFLSGLVFGLLSKDRRILYVFLSYTIVFGLYMIKTGHGFVIHEYYTLPYVPLMALIAGYGLAQIKREKLRIAILCLVVLEGLANQQHDFFIKKSEMYKLQLSGIADQISNTEDLIIINVAGNPQEMYFAHRKGWNIPNEQLELEGVLEDIIARGGRYLFNNRARGELSLQDSVVYQDEHYIIYDLTADR